MAVAVANVYDLHGLAKGIGKEHLHQHKGEDACLCLLKELGTHERVFHNGTGVGFAVHGTLVPAAHLTPAATFTRGRSTRHTRSLLAIANLP